MSWEISRCGVNFAKQHADQELQDHLGRSSTDISRTRSNFLVRPMFLDGLFINSSILSWMSSCSGPFVSVDA